MWISTPNRFPRSPGSARAAPRPPKLTTALKTPLPPLRCLQVRHRSCPSHQAPHRPTPGKRAPRRPLACSRSPLSLAPGFSDLRFYTFPGGCVIYEFHFRPGASPVLAVAVDSALAFQSRSSLVRLVWRTENLVLCGRGAACPR